MLNASPGWWSPAKGRWPGTHALAGGRPCCCDVGGSSYLGGEAVGVGGGPGGSSSSLYPTKPVTSSIGFGVDCPGCLPGTVADEIQAVVTGVKQDPISIFTCEVDVWNATFTLASQGACCYYYSFDKPGLYPLVDMQVCVDQDAIGRFVYFQFYNFRCTLEIPRVVRWRKYLNSDPNAPVDCGFDGIVFTSADYDVAASSDGGLCIDCDLSEATVTLTVV